MLSEASSAGGASAMGADAEAGCAAEGGAAVGGKAAVSPKTALRGATAELQRMMRVPTPLRRVGARPTPARATGSASAELGLLSPVLTKAAPPAAATLPGAKVAVGATEVPAAALTPCLGPEPWALPTQPREADAASDLWAAGSYREHLRQRGAQALQCTLSRRSAMRPPTAPSSPLEQQGTGAAMVGIAQSSTVGSMPSTPVVGGAATTQHPPRLQEAGAAHVGAAVGSLPPTPTPAMPVVMPWGTPTDAAAHWPTTSTPLRASAVFGSALLLGNQVLSRQPAPMLAEGGGQLMQAAPMLADGDQQALMMQPAPMAEGRQQQAVVMQQAPTMADNRQAVMLQSMLADGCQPMLMQMSMGGSQQAMAMQHARLMAEGGQQQQQPQAQQMVSANVSATVPAAGTVYSAGSPTTPGGASLLCGIGSTIAAYDASPQSCFFGRQVCPGYQQLPMAANGDGQQMCAVYGGSNGGATRESDYLASGGLTPASGLMAIAMPAALSLSSHEIEQQLRAAAAMCTYED